MSVAQTEFRRNLPQVRTVVSDTNLYEIPISPQSVKSEGNKDTTARRGLIALAIFSSIVVGLVVFGLVIIIQLQSEMRSLKGQFEHQRNQSLRQMESLDKMSRLNHSVELLLSTVRAFPKDCTSVNRHFAKSQNTAGGVFYIYPESEDKSVEVYCDLVTDGGGWVVFQRRMDGKKDFYRGWNDYVNGFGEMDKEMWLGLETIRQLTKNRSYELRVDLEDFNGNTSYAKYGTFSISYASDRYRLILGEYSGRAGDSLAYHNNMQFSTKDSDNDQASGSCAITWSGAWWYKHCHQSNLNGIYYQNGRDGAQFVNWHSWKFNYLSLKFSEMKFWKRA
ncbi:microfibril-associated glycoprotein 4-like [Styela clava]